MARRLLSLVAMLWMLTALTGFPQLLDTDVLRRVATYYFLGLFALQIIPLVMTYNGSFGHRLHPINVAYMSLASLGLVGSVMLAIVFGVNGGPAATIIAGALLFMGVVGATVLALFAQPWRDWAFKQRESEYLERMNQRLDVRTELRPQLHSAFGDRAFGERAFGEGAFGEKTSGDKGGRKPGGED